MLQAAWGQLCGVVIGSIIWRSIGEFDLWAGEIRWRLQLSIIQFDSIGISAKFNPLQIWLPVVEVCEEVVLVKFETSILVKYSIHCEHEQLILLSSFVWMAQPSLEGRRYQSPESKIGSVFSGGGKTRWTTHPRPMPSQWGSSLQLLMPLKSFGWLVVGFGGCGQIGFKFISTVGRLGWC